MPFTMNALMATAAGSCASRSTKHPATRVPRAGYRAALLCVLGAVQLSAAGSCAAFALDEVYSPNTEYREWSLELSGAQAYDADLARNGAQVGEASMEFGVTPRLTLAASGQYSADPGGSMDLVARELQMRYQLVESGEHWLDAGFLIDYDFAAQSGNPDSVAAKLLLQKDAGRFTHTMNLGFSQNVGHFPQLTDAADYSLLWSTRYRHDETLQPGFELQSTQGAGGQFGYLNQQEAYAGPALYGKLWGHVKYQLAYLFGISDPAANHAVRATLEYEMHF